jgi:MFS family permease
VYPAWRIAVLGVMAALMLLPVTLPVPVLRELVADRFGVSELLTSLFMSINMVGAVLAAPLAGALADRFGRRPLWIGAALALDAVCFLALTRDVSFSVFLGIRFFEGAAHIFALSLLMGLAAGARPDAQRGLVMGATGSGLLLGVASGAPLGGRLGHADPLVPLYVGAAVVAVAALLAPLLLRETEGREAARPGFGEIARLVRASPIVAIPLLFSFADRFSVGFFTSTFPLFLRGVHELPPPRIGLLIAIFMLPFAALSFPFGIVSQRTSRALLMCGGSFVYGCLVASLGFWPTGALVGLMLATGTAAAVMFVPSLLLTSEALPDSLRTTAMGAFNAAGSLGFIVGPVTGGLVSQGVAASFGWPAGYAAAFAVAGGFEIVLGLGTYGVMRRFERKP